MSFNKRLNIVFVITVLAFTLLFAIMILGYFFPNEPSTSIAPWYVWASVGEVFAFLITILITYYIVNKKDKKLKSQSK